MRLLSKILLPIILIAISLAGAGYLFATKPEIEPAPDVEQVWTVRTATIAHRDHQPTLELFGELIAGRDVALRPDVAGKVIEASPKLFEGGRFSEGEMVVRIDPFDYQASIDELDAQIQEAKARRDELQANRTMEASMLDFDQEQLALISRDVERYARLSSSRTASEKAYDDARIAFSQQTGKVEQRAQSIVMVDAMLTQQDAAIARLAISLRRAERDLDNTEVRAPFNGIIADVDAQLGKRLASNDTIARLIDDQNFEISFHLPDSDFGRLWQGGLIGRDLVGRWRLGQTTFEIAARIARVVPTIDAASGGVTVYAKIIDDLEGMPLRPGAFIEIEMPDRLYKNVIELPASALFDGDTVYLVEDERLRPASVKLVAAYGQQVLIQADLEEGRPVVTSRLAEIAPGIKVKVAE